MLFMVIEHFKDKNATAIGDRFKHSGRMLPEGVVYLVSWVDPVGALWFQVMESPSPELLRLWTTRWNDLVDFEIVPVLNSSDFWFQRESHFNKKD
jgi:hypothetical protein